MCVNAYDIYRIIIDMSIEAIPLISPVSDAGYLYEMAMFAHAAI